MGSVVQIGPSADGLPVSGSVPPGAVISLTRVAWRDGGADDAPGARGVSLNVPSGQSVALYGEPPSDTTDLLAVVAGLRRPLSGQVLVGGVEVAGLSGQALDRYRAGLGLLFARFPLVSSLSAIDNVLAGWPGSQPDTATRGRAAELLGITGAGDLSASAGAGSAEQQWRILIARALRTGPRLVLAEDPTPGLDARGATAILDLLMDVQARFGFTLLLSVARLVTAPRCQRLVRMAGASVIEDVLIGGDDPLTRGRIDRVG
jgi:putative ABC transport system ATP-binding protein